MLRIRQACTLLLLLGACSALPQYPGHGNIDDGLQQQQGGLIPVTSQLPQCASHQDCVPYFQCVDGYINTDGSGLIDLRLQPRGTCSQPDYPDVPTICCNIPGVPQLPPFVELCPFQSQCVHEAQCAGIILDATNNMVPYAAGGSWSTCGDSNIPGVCCKPPHLEVCPFQAQCVPEGQCSGTILDNTNTLVSYVAGGSWPTCGDSNIPGVCCKPPHLEVCPFQSQCIQEGQCRGTILDDTNNMVPYAAGGSWSTCGDSNISGVCCKPPHLEECPIHSQCVQEGQCQGNILDNTNTMVPYAVGGSWSTCGDSNIPGVCCEPPRPAPLVTCPGYKVCVSLGQCDAAGNVVTDGSGLFDLRTGGFKQCFVQQTNEIGLCCNPPTTPPPPRQVLDVCPLQSVCVPEILCQDKDP